MSELRATTISDLAGTGPVALTAQSAAKMWATTSPSTSSLTDSLNVSSLSDFGTGDFQTNFASAFDTNTYSVSGMHSSSSNGISCTQAVVVSTTLFRYYLLVNAATVDPAYSAVQAYGDLA